MPANKFALLRYRIIDRSIRSKGSPYPSKEDLRCACEEALYGSDGERISPSTIDKDLWAMRNEGELGYYAPIKFDKTAGGYFYEDPDFTISEIPLNDDDLQAINLAAQTLFQFRDMPVFEQFGSAIEKIMDRMKITRSEEDGQPGRIIQFESVAQYQGSVHLEPLFQAIGAKNHVTFNYEKFGTGEVKSYEIKPYVLKEYRNRWYVIGREVGSGRLLTFGLERIKSMQTGSATFHDTEGFDAERFFSHAIGITVTDEEPEEVILDFDARFAPYITTQPIHGSQKIISRDQNHVRVSITVLITIELITTILGYGEQVIVRQPERLKGEVKEVLTNCLRHY